MIIIIRHVHQAFDLTFDGLRHAAMAMPDPADRPTRKKIEVLVAMRIPNPRPLATLKDKRRLRVTRDDVVVIKPYGLLRF